MDSLILEMGDILILSYLYCDIRSPQCTKPTKKYYRDNTLTYNTGFYRAETEWDIK